MIPSKPLHFWEFFDLYTLGILFVVVGLLIVVHYRKTGGLLGTISQTVAHSRQSSLVFSIVMTICFPLYYAFIWFWVSPLLQMPTWFYYLLVLSALCEIIFVWVPATTGKIRVVHEVMASIVGILMFVTAILILLYATDLSTIDITAALSFIVLTIALGVLLLIRRTRKSVFAYETIYCLGFLIFISVIAHT
jgi:hypothetical protein